MIEEEERRVRESGGQDYDMLLKNNIEGIIIKWAYQVLTLILTAVGIYGPQVFKICSLMHIFYNMVKIPRFLWIKSDSSSTKYHFKKPLKYFLQKLSKIIIIDDILLTFHHI